MQAKVEPQLECLPSLDSTQNLLEESPVDRAEGMGGADADLGTCAHEPVARPVFPMLLKTALQQREPNGSQER